MVVVVVVVTCVIVCACVCVCCVCVCVGGGGMPIITTSDGVQPETEQNESLSAKTVFSC
jgi:hypothetical protein